ncbi:WD40 repeat domain-containing protein [Nocardia thraciensis]
MTSGSPMAGRSEWGRRFARLYQQAGSPTVTEIVSTTRLTNIETIRGWLPGPNNPDPRVPRSWSESLEVVLQDLADRAARAAEHEGRSFGRQPMANWRRWREKAAAEQKARDARTTSPFRGLASYGPEHAEEFFGREDLAQNLAQRISAGFAGSGPRLVVVVGVSGSGKSSLVGAGLAPLIKEGVKVEVFTPGSNPLEALSDAVRHLAGSEAGQVLVADQCEEVWTLQGPEPVEDAEPDSSGRPAVASAFFEQLQSVADRPGTVIVVVIRADFYGSALNHEFLVAGLGAPVNVGAMTREQVRRAIVGPAALCGVTADEDLVELILTELAVSGGDGAHDPGALPHLSHALQEAWKERAAGGKRLTVTHYRKSRGISGSIAKLANSVYESLDSDGQRAIERVLIRSVTGEKIWTRRPVALRELEWKDIPPHVVDAVVDRFIHERLLTADRSGRWTVLPGSFNDGAATLRYNPVTAVLATVDAAEMPALWDAESLNPLPLPAGTITKVQSVAFSRDGQTMALADSGIVQIHRGGKPSRTIRESVNELRAIALDQHGRRLVLADHNGTVRWWDLDTGDETGRFVALDTAARSIDFGADNTVIALTQENHSVRLLDTATDDNSLADLVGHTDMVTSLAFSPDYSTLATTGVDGTIALWRIDPTLMRHHRWADATALAYTVDGTILAAAARDGTVTTYDTATGEPVNSAPGCAEASTGTADAVAVSTDARYSVLSCNGRPGHVRISDLTNHRNLGVDIPVARFPPALALSPDNTLLATGNYLNHLELWGLGTLAVLPTSPTVSIPIASTIRALAFSPDGKYLAYAADNGTVAVYLAADLRPGVDKPAAQVLSVLNTSGTSDRRPGSAGFTYRTITFSADSAGIAVSGDDGSIRIWQRTSTGFEPALILTSRPANVHALAFSTDPNNPAIVTANREGSRRRWTLDTDDVAQDVCTAATGAIDELTDLGSLLDDWKC